MKPELENQMVVDYKKHEEISRILGLHGNHPITNAELMLVLNHLAQTIEMSLAFGPEFLLFRRELQRLYDQYEGYRRARLQV